MTQRAIHLTAIDIIESNLEGHFAVDADGDEFDRFAGNINRMLGRPQVLIERFAQISIPPMTSGRRDPTFAKPRRVSGFGPGAPLVAAAADLYGIRIKLADNRPGLKVQLVFADVAYP